MYSEKMTIVSQAAQTTRDWVQHFVLAHGLCPYAAPYWRDMPIHVLEIEDFFDALEHCMQYIADFAASDHDTTALIVLTRATPEFIDFIDLLRLAERDIERRGLGAVLQLAHFHPHYTFAEGDEAEHFSNRSPWPTLHLLRHATVDQVVRPDANAMTIPERNKRHLRSIGVETLRQNFVKGLQPQ